MLDSAPFTLAGRTLWLRATDTSAFLYYDCRLVATRLRGHRPGERISVRDHLPPAAQAFFAHYRAWCVHARDVGSACAELFERLLADRILERLRAARGRPAAARDLRRRSPGGGVHARTVPCQPLLLPHGQDHPGRRLRPTAAEPAEAPQEHAPGARFARSAQLLFDPDAPRH